MRTKCVCWGVVFCTMLTGASLQAQQPPAGSPTSYPAEMAIIVPEVEVRSGPTKGHYPTAKLHQGDRVTVVRDVKDQPGWAAIKPPAGSFSWIREKHVKRVDARNGFVEAPGNAAVAILPGSSLVQQALNVESAKVPSGSLVVVLDRPFHCEGENWLPILPMPDEVRYVPTSALKLPPAPVTVAAGFPTSVGGGDVLGKADEAYRAGNLELARQLYRQAVEKLAEPQKSYAQNRLASMSAAPVSTSTQSHWLPVGGQSVPPPSSPSGATTPIGAVPIGAAPIGSAPIGAPPAASTPAGQTISNYTAPHGSMISMEPAQWSKWGYLRKAGFEKDGQPVFVLETSQGAPLIYAVEQPGSRTVLSKMIGRPVCLYGPIAYRAGDVPRMPYMVASWYATP